ncbi:MAG TPA: hypothetical protein VLD39_07310 [Gammaproteobacteria bacterium]|nr:hypothetical protein [Gammaproteobacteria bacterium]
MASLLGEIRRRKVFQVAAAYLVVAWLLVQVITAIEAPLRLPDWFDTAVIVLLAIGFPVTVVMSWAFNLTPEGLVRDEGTGVAGNGRSSEQILIGLLIVAVGWLLFQDMRAPNDAVPAAAALPAIEPAPDQADATAAARSRLANSIAVLPFANLSPDPNNDYFAAGIHEEILNQLVKLRNLNVIARTSVLQYADVRRPITEIAEELNVETIMEGSVSYADGRVAVAAQLIDAQTGVHIWSERYNAEFANVFEIQADMAMNIANALEAEFSAAEQARITELPTESIEAYGLYLEALGAFQDGPRIIPLLDEAVRLDPQFALAYALKAQLLASRGRGDLAAGIDDWEQAVRDAAETAIELDPRLAAPHAALASIHHANWRWAEAERAYSDAYRLNSNDTAVLGAYATLKRDVGDYTEAIRLFRRAVELDPRQSANQLAITYRYNRDYEAAIRVHREQIALNPGNGGFHAQLAFAEIARGNRDEGLRELQTAERLGILPDVFWRKAQTALAYGRLGRRGDVERLLAPMLRGDTASGIGHTERAVGHLALTEYDRAREELAAALENPGGENLPLLGQIKANDYGDPMLEEPEWRALRDRIGAL